MQRHRSLFMNRIGRSGRSTSLQYRLLLVLAAFAVGATACSSSGATAEAATPTDSTAAAECFLGLDLWDTDPALTWIEDGRVWVRAGDHQACLAFSDASDLWWSPDGRRLFLDDEIVAGDSIVAEPDVAAATQIVWQQPAGEALHVVDADGTTRLLEIGSNAASSPLQLSGTVLLASHPDGEHFATVDQSGLVSLVSATTGKSALVLALSDDERPLQMDFSPDASRLWVLTDTGSASVAKYIDLEPISSFLDIEPVESMVPVSEPLEPLPNLYYLDVDLAASSLELEGGVGATGIDASEFVLHPSHPDWIVLTEGNCAAATSTLFMDGAVASDGIPGAAVGFFRGRGLPILATSSAGDGCGQGQLWVTSGLPITDSPILVADEVLAADIRVEAPDPWNPNAAPPFA